MLETLYELPAFHSATLLITITLYWILMQALYDEMVPAFDVLGKKSFFLGEVGNGAKFKLVVNMIMGRYVIKSKTLAYLFEGCFSKV